MHLLGRREEAVAAYQEALKLIDYQVDAHAGLALALAELGREDEALTHFAQGDRFGSLPGNALIRYAELLEKRERYADAIEGYRRGLLQIQEPAPAILNRVAWLLATCPDVALRDCELATEIAEENCRRTNNRHPVALDTLAAAYAECGRYQDAITAVSQAIDIARENGNLEAITSFQTRLRQYQRLLSNK